MCGQGLNPFSSRSGQNVQDLLKDNNIIGITVSFIIIIFWFKWGGGRGRGRGIWQVKILLSGRVQCQCDGPRWGVWTVLEVVEKRFLHKFMMVI